jgi:magnesium chelatase family protein
MSDGFRIGAPLSGESRPTLQWIEIASFLQIPSFQLIGLPGPEVAEARERVRAAITASGLEFPRRRLVLNLSPASIRKRGTGADLAMALAILQEVYPPRKRAPVREGRLVAWGELGLDGSLKAAGQVMSAVYAAWEEGARAIVMARSDLPAALECAGLLERSLLLGGQPAPALLAADSLTEAWEILQDLEARVDHARAETALPGPDDTSPGPARCAELLPISGALERLLCVAASGCHHLLILGPRGTGKSHALEWLIALQPEASPAIQVRRALLSDLGGEPGARHKAAPVRRVSSHVRPAALIGQAGHHGVKPGEFSMAHGGLLLADELPEWQRDSREALREPLECGHITLTRARQSVERPARFALAANGNLCPCGGWPTDLPLPHEVPGEAPPSPCLCPASARRRYLARISGPILDRLDLVALMARSGSGPARSSVEELRERVARTRERTERRWGAAPALLGPGALEELLREHPPWAEALERQSLASLRARHKCLRVALTLAAWDGLDEPARAAFQEASCYRPERFGLVG